MEVRIAKTPRTPFAFRVTLFLVIWGLTSIVLFSLIENTFLAVCLVAVGLPIFMLAIGWERRYIKQVSSIKIHHFSQSFSCQTCEKRIESPIENFEKHGAPILFHCEPCKVLWYVGLHYDLSS